MSPEISLFSGYSAKENRTTNYCLLMLKMLYEENPSYLGEVLSALCETPIKIGVEFAQQTRMGDSVPDGLITQTEVRVLIEAKNYDWFYDDQLERHLSNLKEIMGGGTGVLIALANFEAIEADRFKTIQEAVGKIDRIEFFARTFEQFLEALSVEGLSKQMLNAIQEFNAYLTEEQLLPTWSQMMDIVSCSTAAEEVLEGNVFHCPALSGPYWHARCRYFGMYRDKRVEAVAEIRAVVDIDLDSEGGRVLWINEEGLSKSEATNIAKRGVQAYRPDQGPVRALLLGERYPTDYRRASKGGIRTKTYKDIRELSVVSAEELVDKLNGRTW